MIKKIPLVSVAIITYNQKPFLIECIESILLQDYGNIEIVIADDYSTDGTREVLKEYDSKYPDKFVLKLANQNQGITKNSNLAHFACNGKYIAWMGGDDIMLPGKIRTQVEYMEAHSDCTICYHNLDVFQSETNETLYYLNEKNKISGDVRAMLKFGTFNGACSSMVRSDKAPTVGFDERIPIASDYLYWAETLLNGGEIHYLDFVLGKYRKHSLNITNKNINITFRNEIDHLNSCNILLIKAPQYRSEILFRYSEILRGLRIKDKKNYLNYLLASLKVGLNVKSLLSLLVYMLSFGWKKK